MCLPSRVRAAGGRPGRLAPLAGPLAAQFEVVDDHGIDLQALRDYLLGRWQPDAAWLQQADLNGDGRIDIADITELTRLQQ